MNITELMESIKRNPRYADVGMVLYHNGVVRGTSRDGRPVKGLRIRVDHDKLAAVLTENRKKPGIMDIRVWINEDKDLTVGEDVMFLAVAGDIRENVLSTLETTLNTIKSTVTAKTEYFV
ncbi:MAG: molybdenum cofactor biosynthesis protein MoaE [Desulfobacterales bacterium]|jgi:molybdopterin synthase catalytic subunit|nr:molybdenum cofactor biosynthesis protein MoaE [Desulfobacterales bacterium]